MKGAFIMEINVLLFDGFEPLDVFGPTEVLGFAQNCTVHYFSMNGGIITTKEHLKVMTKSVKEIDSSQVLMVPGGIGTRTIVNDKVFIDQLADLMKACKFCLCVCTGTALMAKTGLLNGLNATTNKMAFDWVVSVNDKVNWNKSARWVIDGKYYTSSGVSAGTDMALGFIADQFGEEEARKIAGMVEYIWNDDPNNDPFAKE